MTVVIQTNPHKSITVVIDPSITLTTDIIAISSLHFARYDTAISRGSLQMFLSINVSRINDSDIDYNIISKLGNQIGVSANAVAIGSDMQLRLTNHESSPVTVYILRTAF